MSLLKNRISKRKQGPMHGHLQAKQIDVAYRDFRVISELDLEIPVGQLTAVIGPNACGKSTLIKTLGRILKPTAGHVFLDQKEIHSLNSKNVAKVLGLLPQHPIAPEGITVEDLVSRGRTPHQSFLQQHSSNDAEAVDMALELTDTADLRDRSLDSLSGGQKQRVWLAMAICQNPRTLLLDEPTSYLDITHQLEMLELIVSLKRELSCTIVIVIHDLNLAARYADFIVAMKAGSILYAGTPEEVITKGHIRQIFDLDASVLSDPNTNSPVVVPHHRIR